VHVKESTQEKKVGATSTPLYIDASALLCWFVIFCTHLETSQTLDAKFRKMYFVTNGLGWISKCVPKVNAGEQRSEIKQHQDGGYTSTTGEKKRTTVGNWTYIFLLAQNDETRPRSLIL